MTTNQDQGAILEEFFPKVDSGVTPISHKIIIQYKSPKKKSNGGIILTEEASDSQMYWTQTARIVALGPLCFKDRETLEDWPEIKKGVAYPKVGDFIRTPLHNQDRWKIAFKREGSELEEQALFGVINDTSIFGTVVADPKTIMAMD